MLKERCLFPKYPPPETVTNCSDGGVFGVVPGIIGSLQALEVQKIILGMEGVLSERLLIFNGLYSTFKNVKIRGKQKSCQICGENKTITTLKKIDFQRNCEVVQELDKKYNISAISFNEEVLEKKVEHILLDVRVTTQFEICSLPNSISKFQLNLLDVPVSQLEKKFDELKELQKDKIIYVYCRRGIA
jgi:adenylyltransferase and sulfurtransferase